MKAAEPFEIVAFEIQRAQRPSFFERGLARDQYVAFALQIGGPILLEIFFEPLQPPLGDAEIREDQFVFHRLRVACGVD